MRKNTYLTDNPIKWTQNCNSPGYAYMVLPTSKPSSSSSFFLILSNPSFGNRWFIGRSDFQRAPILLLYLKAHIRTHECIVYAMRVCVRVCVCVQKEEMEKDWTICECMNCWLSYERDVLSLESEQLGQEIQFRIPIENRGRRRREDDDDRRRRRRRRRRRTKREEWIEK